ncbi:MMPL family transporter [bacterium]|nr:MMPL family transporter [bacterium]
MSGTSQKPLTWWAGWSTRRPLLVLVLVFLTLPPSFYAISRLGLQTNMIDMLPSHHPDAKRYIEVQERFGEPSLVVVLEGTRDSIVAMARELEPRLHDLPGLYNVQGRAPMDFIRRYGLVLQEPSDLNRSLTRLHDPNLLGMLRGLNDDFETEYADNADNLRRDELDVATSMHGLQRSLELMHHHLAGDTAGGTVGDAVDAMIFGEPWALSLDRRMLLIVCTPRASFWDNEAVIAITERVDSVMTEVGTGFPDVEANLTGLGPLQRDEMATVSTDTQWLTLAALVLIYLLLVFNFRGWMVPLRGIAPLALGIVWTLAVLELLFGQLNLFTAMIMLVLMGLGIDFSIHLMSRYYEGRNEGRSIREAAEGMVGGTGRGVLTGGLTTAAAFLALMIADTRGVFQFGAAAGVGVVLTLLAVFVLLPALLALRDRVQERLPHSSGPALRRQSLDWIGRAAVAAHRHAVVVLIVFALLAGVCLWAARHNEYEYDMMNLEPPGLKSVQLQREIPERFGTTDQGAFVIAESIEQSRRLKDELKELSTVGEVASISDWIPAPGWGARQTELLSQLRSDLARARPDAWSDETSQEMLYAEIERLWDNLDLMSNLAFQSGLDRIVRTIDQVTGYDSETNSTDSTAILPRLLHRVESGIPSEDGLRLTRAWYDVASQRLGILARYHVPGIEDLPPSVRRAHLPRDGNDAFLLNVSARRYLFDREALERFDEQTSQVAPGIVGSPKLTIVTMHEILLDGRNGALLALGVIVVLLMLHFRGPVGLLAIVPLLGATLLMLGMMVLLGVKYDFMNLIAVPIILGIGIDDGVHALHRFRETRAEGTERYFDCFRHVGRAILMTSLSTMIGFGNLAFYRMPTVAGFGLVLFFGVGLCFAATAFVLPAVMRLFRVS